MCDFCDKQPCTKRINFAEYEGFQPYLSCDYCLQNAVENIERTTHIGWIIDTETNIELPRKLWTTLK
jgi:hypothetical protein